MRSVRRCIPLHPDHNRYYLVDANFLANKRINPELIQDPSEKQRVERAKEYWKVIDAQLKKDEARVYILDLCIAEAFKVLAKKYYNKEKIFNNHSSYKHGKESLQKDIQLSIKDARSSKRVVRYHDIQTNRDIIISVDRFFEKACKQKKGVSVVDLLILACSKYLIDFYGIKKEELYIISQDQPLYELAKSYQELPSSFNPSQDADIASKVFSA